MSRRLSVRALGLTDYSECLDLQRRLALDRISGTEPDDILLLVEHPPVITVGRSSDMKHLLASPDALAERGVEVHDIDRGGDVTFHGRGQLVGYLIYDLKQHKQDLHWFLRKIEEALIGVLGQYGIEGTRNKGLTGVWVEDRKIASIGIHVKQWVTWHGFALNVTTDLSYFQLIVPCGIDGVRMTNIRSETDVPEAELALGEVGRRAGEEFARVFRQETGGSGGRRL